MISDRGDRILRAGWLKPTGWGQQRRNSFLIPSNRSNQNLFHTLILKEFFNSSKNPSKNKSNSFHPVSE
jgi:hypothetical protein